MSKTRREAAQAKRALRKQPDGHYTAIHNSVLTDSSLSPVAFRVVMYLASRPDSWELRTADIMKNCDLSRYAVEQVARPELTEAGYLDTKLLRGSNGKIIAQETRLVRSLVVYLGNGKLPGRNQTDGIPLSGESPVWTDLENTDVSPGQNQTQGIPGPGNPSPLVSTKSTYKGTTEDELPPWEQPNYQTQATTAKTSKSCSCPRGMTNRDCAIHGTPVKVCKPFNEGDGSMPRKAKPNRPKVSISEDPWA